MMVIVTRHVEFARPGTPLTFSVGPSTEPQRLPHDVQDYVVATGAGYLVPAQPGNRNGGVAATIERKRR